MNATTSTPHYQKMNALLRKMAVRASSTGQMVTVEIEKYGAIVAVIPNGTHYIYTVTMGDDTVASTSRFTVAEVWELALN